MRRKRRKMMMSGIIMAITIISVILSKMTLLTTATSLHQDNIATTTNFQIGGIHRDSQKVMPATASASASSRKRRRRRRERRTASRDFSSSVSSMNSIFGGRSDSSIQTTTISMRGGAEGDGSSINGSGSGVGNDILLTTATTATATTIFFETLSTILVTLTTFLWCYSSKILQILPLKLPSILVQRIPFRKTHIEEVESIKGIPSSSSSSSLSPSSFAETEKRSTIRRPPQSVRRQFQRPSRLRSLQLRYWTVFWLMRCAYWMSGPYIVPIYRQKLLHHQQQQLQQNQPPSVAAAAAPAPVVVQNQIMMIFVCGFVVQILLGPTIMGQITDFWFGRKFATILYGVMLAVGMSSLKYNSSSSNKKMFVVLLLGRAFMGCGQSLLPTAPESWLSTEAQRQGQHHQPKEQLVANKSNGNDNDNIRKSTSTTTVESETGNDFVGKTIGTAYTGDAFVAILAGKLASWAASSNIFRRASLIDPPSRSKHGGKNLNAPFDLATIILGVGCIATSFLWNENTALSTTESSSQSSLSTSTSSPLSSLSSMNDAYRLILNDPKLILLCAVQALVGSATSLFILHWTTVISQSVDAVGIGMMCGSGCDGNNGGGCTSIISPIATVPYGTIFSCFMTCSLLGSMIFGSIMKIKAKTTNRNDTRNDDAKNCSSSNVSIPLPSSTVETLCSIMLIVATGCMSIMAWLAGSVTLSTSESSPSSIFRSVKGRWIHLVLLTASMCLYEGCIGMYYPMTGVLRNKLIPSSHKSLIASMFGIPLNVLVIITYLLSAAGTTTTTGSAGSTSSNSSADSLCVASLLLSVATVYMIRLRSITRSSSSKTNTDVGIIDI